MVMPSVCPWRQWRPVNFAVFYVVVIALFAPHTDTFATQSPSLRVFYPVTSKSPLPVVGALLHVPPDQPLQLRLDALGLPTNQDVTLEVRTDHTLQSLFAVKSTDGSASLALEPLQGDAGSHEEVRKHMMRLRLFSKGGAEPAIEVSAQFDFTVVQKGDNGVVGGDENVGPNAVTLDSDSAKAAATSLRLQSLQRSQVDTRTVMTWSVGDTLRFLALNVQGFSDIEAAVLRRERIDGGALLALEESDLREMHICVGQRKGIMRQVRLLQSAVEGLAASAVDAVGIAGVNRNSGAQYDLDDGSIGSTDVTDGGGISIQVSDTQQLHLIGEETEHGHNGNHDTGDVRGNSRDVDGGFGAPGGRGAETNGGGGSSSIEFRALHSGGDGIVILHPQPGQMLWHRSQLHMVAAVRERDAASSGRVLAFVNGYEVETPLAYPLMMSFPTAVADGTHNLTLVMYGSDSMGVPEGSASVVFDIRLGSDPQGQLQFLQRPRIPRWLLPAPNPVDRRHNEEGARDESAGLTVVWTCRDTRALDWVKEMLGPLIVRVVMDATFAAVARDVLVVVDEAELGAMDPAVLLAYLLRLRGGPKDKGVVNGDPNALGSVRSRIGLLHLGDITGHSHILAYTFVDYVYRNHWHHDVTGAMLHHGQAPHAHVLTIPLGYPTGFWDDDLIDTRDRHHFVDFRPAMGRRYTWSFVGEVRGPGRKSMIAAAEKIDGGLLHVVDVSDHGGGEPHVVGRDHSGREGELPVSEYHSVLLNSKVALCPPNHIGLNAGISETRRLYEALEAGAIPITLGSSTVSKLFGTKHPIPMLRDWSELDSLISSIDFGNKQRQCVRWWRAHKDSVRATMVDLYNAE